MEGKKCPCRRVNCKRHGDCAACREHHHNVHKIPLTTCERIEAKKKKPKRGTSE